MAYSPKTGAKCGCKRGIHRDNCPACEGTGWVIDFRAIREAVKAKMEAEAIPVAKESEAAPIAEAPGAQVS